MHHTKHSTAIFAVVILIGSIFSQFYFLTREIYLTNFQTTAAEQKVNPTFNLKKIGEYTLARQVVGIQIRGNLAFIADQNEGCIILNISNKINPTFINKYQITDEGIYDLIIEEDIGFLAYGRAGVQILNLSNPYDIKELSFFNDGGLTWRLFLKEKYLFVADRNEGIEILDVSNLTNPKQIGQYLGNPFDVFVSGYYAYIATGSQTSLDIVNIRDPHTPIKTAEIKFPLFDTVAVYGYGDYMYVANKEDGVQIVKVTNPKKPKVISNYIDTNEGKAWDVFVKDHLIYIANEKGGTEVLDISNPTSPIEVGQYYDDSGQTFQLTIDEQFIYSADFNDGLEILTWKIAAPNPMNQNYHVIDTGVLNFNHSIGPFLVNKVLGNETVRLNLSLLLDVGLMSPINITVEAPNIIYVDDLINLRINIAAEKNKFWAQFRGIVSFITPIGSADLISLEDVGIPEFLELAAFKTFIGQNLTKNTNLSPITLWQRDFLNYTLSLVMTPLFNVTGTAIVEATVENENKTYSLEWISDEEQILIPIKVPKIENEYYGVPLNDLHFKITNLHLDLYQIKFEVLAENILQLYNWTINITDFTSTEELGYIPKRSQIVAQLPSIQAYNRTLFFLNGLYPLGDFIIFIHITQSIQLPSWFAPLVLIGVLLLMLLPWGLIFYSMKRGGRKQLQQPIKKIHSSQKNGYKRIFTQKK